MSTRIVTELVWITISGKDLAKANLVTFALHYARELLARGIKVNRDNTRLSYKFHCYGIGTFDRPLPR